MRFLITILLAVAFGSCSKKNNKPSAIEKDTYTDTVIKSQENSETNSDIILPEDNTKIEDSTGKELYYDGN